MIFSTSPPMANKSIDYTQQQFAHVFVAVVDAFACNICGCCYNCNNIARHERVDRRQLVQAR